MPKWKMVGFDKYIRSLEKLADPFEVNQYIGKAIYEGASVIADATKAALESLPVDNREKLPEGQRKTSINQLQKRGLIESYGVAPSRWDGDFLNVKVGFDGYNDIVTNRWPMGQPNVVIARALESGTSFMNKNPIISKTENANKDKCFAKMQESLNKSIDELMK